MVSTLSVIGGMIGYQINQRAMQVLERAVSYAAIETLVIPEFEKMNLEYFVKQFVKEPIKQQKILNMLKDSTQLKPINDFVEFLKDYNLRIARRSIQAGILSTEAGNIASRLLSAIQWSYGFGWLSWVGMSPILNAVVANPANRALEAEFRYKDTPRSIVEGLYKTGAISEDELREYYRKEGYTDKAIKRFILDLDADMRKEKRELSRTQIIRAYKLGIFSKSFTIAKLEQLGYSSEDAEFIVNMAEMEESLDSIERGRDLSKTDIIKAWKKGVIDKDTAYEMLKQLGYSPAEAFLLIRINE